MTAQQIAERIRMKVQDHPIAISSDTRLSISISAGVTSGNTMLRSVDSLLSRADNLLYVSKRNGKNQVSIDKDGLNVSSSDH